MAINVQILDRSARIIMSGRFEFDLHRDFKNAYSPLLNNAVVREIEIEMSKVDFMDTAALGMLLLLKDRAERAGKRVSLLNASNMVLQVFEISNFSKIFNTRNSS